MADDQDNSQDYVIKTNQGDFRIRASKDMPQDQVLRLAASKNETFAQIYSQNQAKLAGQKPLSSGVLSQAEDVGSIPVGSPGFPTHLPGPQSEDQDVTRARGVKATGEAIESAPTVAAAGASMLMGPEVGLLTRMGTTTAAAGGTALATGKTPGEAAKEGIIQGALPELGGAVVGKGLELLGKAAPTFIKNLIKPSEAMFAYGKDPVKFVSELKGGIPGNKAELAKQIFQELEDTGNQITSRLKQVENAFPNAPHITKLDVGRSINDPIDKKIAEIAADRGMKDSVRKGILEQLEDFRKGIMTDAGGKAQPTVVKLTEANTLKQQIGKGTNWKITADPVESAAQPIINGLRKEIYANIRQGIEQQASKVGVTDIKDLNTKYGSGLDAMKSIEKRMNTGPVLTMSDLVTALGSPTAAAVKKGLSTTPGAIGAARLSKAAGKVSGVGGGPVSQLLRVIAGMLESGENTSEPQKSNAAAQP